MSVLSLTVSHHQCMRRRGRRNLGVEPASISTWWESGGVDAFPHVQPSRVGFLCRFRSPFTIIVQTSYTWDHAVHLVWMPHRETRDGRVNMVH